MADMKVYNIKHPSGVETQMQLTEADAKAYGDNATVAGDLPVQEESTVAPGPADPEVAYDRGVDEDGKPIEAKSRSAANKSRSAQNKSRSGEGDSGSAGVAG